MIGWEGVEGWSDRPAEGERMKQRGWCCGAVGTDDGMTERTTKVMGVTIL